MKTWTRRIRAAIGMGLTWAAAWAAAGTVLARVPGFSSDVAFALLPTPLGFVTGVIFAAIIAEIEGRRGFARTSLPRFAVWGAASDLLLSGSFVVGAALRGGRVWREFRTFGPPLAMAGAICAAASLAVARRAEQQEIAGQGTSNGAGAPTGD